MEALAQVLSCPVCLELFTPPVLLLSCTHNFCKKCLEEILIHQNGSQVNGQFSCPMCRKVIHLRGRGITGLPRNTLVENILEKFKYELENLHIKEESHLSQICKEHGEIMNLETYLPKLKSLSPLPRSVLAHKILYLEEDIAGLKCSPAWTQTLVLCLTDDKPICVICKLFGDHESHSVAQISKVYTERKSRLVKDLDWMFQQSQCAEQAKKDIEKKKDDLKYITADVKVMIDAVGASLLKEIRKRMLELKAKLGKDYSAKLEMLQLVENELQVPSHLHHQMKTLLEKHSNSVCFLQEDKLLRKEFSNEYFCQKLLGFLQKSNKMKEDVTQNIPESDGTETPNGTHFSLDSESASRLKPTYNETFCI